MSALFTPFKLKDVTLRNRIAVPPMCQYSAEDGVTTNWHQVHYPSIARGGAGLVIVEATGVSPEGRITPGCTGLWNDTQAEGMARIAAGIAAAGAVPGIQIGHAGRKASANLPWEGDDHIPEGDPRAWQPLAPSAIAFGGGLGRVPKAMTLDDIAKVKTDFVAAARRARDAGFQWLELHFAHGYLAQSFFSPYSNQRTDEYGGSFDNRGRFLLETLAAVREVWPENLPLTARFGVIEYDGNDEATLTESIALVRRMHALGIDLLNVSMNFVIPGVKVPWGTEAFLAPIAERVRREAKLPVASGWCIDGPHVAERVISNQQMDVVMMGRAHLADPHYPYQIAQALAQAEPVKVLPTPYAYWLSRYKGPGTASAQ
ncbi:NADH:flavin oxidoreductase/NADH oxidase [Dyella telluris]|uniref:NADH:flavin oxidoreductase/NADH oxidase n=1 Tax=Dyella telluris TaxID=2763498 RepID=A0A7G8Q3I7_9GAMM|nr:NADH:flavin oxidoreductase/NADH oxidase [Dyella telluris]QNK01345.1 NADH:flavin oxidoreductase/NADH oxidase [Dyella telluris]